jgi:hypothetical protein
MAHASRNHRLLCMFLSEPLSSCLEKAENRSRVEHVSCIPVTFLVGIEEVTEALLNIA